MLCISYVAMATEHLAGKVLIHAGLRAANSKAKKAILLISIYSLVHLIQRVSHGGVPGRMTLPTIRY